MTSHSWRQILIEWAAVACAATVFVAVAIDAPEVPAGASTPHAVTIEHGG